MRSTGKNRPLEDRVESALASAGVKDGARILAAVSGGPDSTALLASLSAIAPRHGFSLHACSVDHGMRPRAEVEEDLEWVRGLCASLGVPCRVARVPEGECRARARAEKRSLEEVARAVRLSLLREAAVEVGAEAVALGHTRDDAAETLLMAVLQGADAAGLRGIPLRRGMLVRPLLSCDRAQVISYLRGKGLGFRTDPTNQDRRFLRNRIRHEIVPALRRVLPGFPAGLLGTAARMTLLDSFLKEESVRRLPWRRAGGGFRLPADLFFSASPALRAQSLLHLFDLVKAGGPSRRLPARFLTPVLGERPPAGGILLRGHGVRLRADGGELAWERDIVTPIKKSYLMTAETDGIYHVRCAGACVELKWAAREDTVVGDAEIRACAVDPPLVLRSKRRGDGLPLEHGRKSLKELYCEWKVPPEDRQAIPLLADRRGVVAVLGGAWGHPTRVRSGARAQGAEERVIIRVRRDREAEAPREGTREQQF